MPVPTVGARLTSDPRVWLNPCACLFYSAQNPLYAWCQAEKAAPAGCVVDVKVEVGMPLLEDEAFELVNAEEEVHYTFLYRATCCL